MERIKTLAIHPPPAYGEEVEFLPTNVKILERSAEITKGQFSIYFVMLIMATSISGMILNMIFNLLNVNVEFLTIIPMITSVIVRYYEELLRIRILENSDFIFNM